MDNSGYVWQALLIRQDRNPTLVGFAGKNFPVWRRIFYRAGTHRNIPNPAIFLHNHGFILRGSGHRFYNVKQISVWNTLPPAIMFRNLDGFYIRAEAVARAVLLLFKRYKCNF